MITADIEIVLLEAVGAQSIAGRFRVTVAVSVGMNDDSQGAAASCWQASAYRVPVVPTSEPTKMLTLTAVNPDVYALALVHQTRVDVSVLKSVNV